jgi:sugar (pentulose or hexulose) kinase
LNHKTALTIDCGTQSLRALLFSQDGELLANARETYTPYVSPRPGWAEQDPEVYWSAKFTKPWPHCMLR